MSVFEVLPNYLASRDAAKRLDNEIRDIHEADLPLANAIGSPVRLEDARGNIVGNGKVIAKVRGMGKVYDWRHSSWTPASGGRIKPLIYVEHIPVIPQAAGIIDFVRLRDVLVAQGLMVQNATDGEGNVALFTRMDELCWQAKGANQLSCGCEHIHLSTSDPWTRKQFRASAWLWDRAQKGHNIPLVKASLGSGKGIVRVFRRGHTTHEEVSNKAGFHDRSDPGKGYDFEYVFHCVKYYRKHGHFANA